MPFPFRKSTFRRRTYVIDRPMQVSVALQVTASLALVALMYLAAMFIFLGRDAVSGMSISVIRSFLLTTNTIYFVLAGTILVVLTLLVTHRFAGPAYVMRQALDGMMKGDYGRRLKLRDRDYLKELASSLELFRAKIARHDRELHQALDAIAAHLREGDADEAEAVLSRLRSERLVRPETLPPALQETTPPKRKREAATVAGS